MRHDYLPTIEQILAKADTIKDEPMSEEECREWFNRTVKQNEEREATNEQ